MATGELVRRDICFKDLGVVVEENVDSIKKKVAQRLTVSHFFDPVKH